MKFELKNLKRKLDVKKMDLEQLHRLISLKEENTKEINQKIKQY